MEKSEDALLYGQYLIKNTIYIVLIVKQISLTIVYHSIPL